MLNSEVTDSVVAMRAAANVLAVAVEDLRKEADWIESSSQVTWIEEAYEARTAAEYLLASLASRESEIDRARSRALAGIRETRTAIRRTLEAA